MAWNVLGPVKRVSSHFTRFIAFRRFISFQNSLAPRNEMRRDSGRCRLVPPGRLTTDNWQLTTTDSTHSAAHKPAPAGASLVWPRAQVDPRSDSTAVSAYSTLTPVRSRAGKPVVAGSGTSGRPRRNSRSLPPKTIPPLPPKSVWPPSLILRFGSWNAQSQAHGSEGERR
jgi:hypothetical protein